MLKNRLAARSFARACSNAFRPTLTVPPRKKPTKEQMEEFGLSKPLGSPNGAMRKGWNGITISRDTIHIEVRVKRS